MTAVRTSGGPVRTTLPGPASPRPGVLGAARRDQPHGSRRFSLRLARPWNPGTTRCHRKIVPGVTISRIAARRSAGTVPASSASHARSSHVRRE